MALFNFMSGVYHPHLDRVEIVGGAQQRSNGSSSVVKPKVTPSSGAIGLTTVASGLSESSRFAPPLNARQEGNRNRNPMRH